MRSVTFWDLTLNSSWYHWDGGLLQTKPMQQFRNIASSATVWTFNNNIHNDYKTNRLRHSSQIIMCSYINTMQSFIRERQKEGIPQFHAFWDKKITNCRRTVWVRAETGKISNKSPELFLYLPCSCAEVPSLLKLDSFSKVWWCHSQWKTADTTNKPE